MVVGVCEEFGDELRADVATGTVMRMLRLVSAIVVERCVFVDVKMAVDLDDEFSCLVLPPPRRCQGLISRIYCHTAKYLHIYRSLAAPVSRAVNCQDPIPLGIPAQSIFLHRLKPIRILESCGAKSRLYSSRPKKTNPPAVRPMI